METPSLVKKLNEYGIALRVENGELACDAETPIPKSIELTISTHERKLLSYLQGNKATVFQTDESKSHNLTSNEGADLLEESSTNSRVPNQAQNNSIPLLNKGIGDKAHYRTAFETISGGPQVVEDRDNLTNYQRAGNLHLPPVLLKNLMTWVAKFHELRISHPDGLTLNATPEHVRDAVKLHPWGVVYNPERYLLMSWGDVPRVTLLGLRDLETGELLIPEQVAA